MERKPIVQIRNLHKKIGSKNIINGISFDIYPGEVFGFLGPNGAGKTTTMRMMVGLISITDGEVLINGLSIKENFEKAISHVGGIVENPEMYKFLSGYQNLEQYSRMMKGIDKARIDEVVKLVGLEKRIKDKVKTYSLGMRQRLGLAQALLHSPSVLILDEPTNGLDPAGIREIRDYLQKLAKEEGMAIMVSSHILSEMELMCDRIAIIQNGRIVDVQKVNEFGKEEENINVVFDVEPLQAAKEYFIEREDITFNIMSNEIYLEIDREKIPQVTADLVNKGVKIYGIQSISKSLEDKFLEITGGNEIE